MRINIEILKKARENNASVDCMYWLIDNINENITIDTIDVEHYLWLISIGCTPNLRLFNYCKKQSPRNALKFALHYIDNEFIEYCARLCPVQTIKYAMHRLTPKTLEKCVEESNNQIAYNTTLDFIKVI